MKQPNKQKGYSMLELLLASAVGGIVIAGSYASYSIVAKQYQRISAFAEVQEAGMPTIRLLSRDIRLSGLVELDSSLDPVYGTIATPVTITDSGDACCDSIQLIYDKPSTDRRRVTYSIAARTSPARNALYMDIETWSGTAWVASIDDALVTDYVEDLQFVGSDNDSNGNSRIVDISMVIRSQSTLNRTVTYAPPAQVVGNYDYSFSDNFYRDEFTATVNVKNLR